jgi:hypothetical protein
MKIKDLFTLRQGNSLELMHTEASSSSSNACINFVSRTAQNNGVVAQVEKTEGIEPFPPGCISVALNGSVLSAFVQTKPFYTAFHVMVLEPEREMTLSEKLYYCMCITSNAYRYNYGRQANKTLKDIELPDTIPEWVYNTPVKPIKTAINPFSALLHSREQRKEFRVGNLFDVKRTTALSVQNTEKGDCPYVSRSGVNNGIVKYVSSEGHTLNAGNCITIGGEGIIAFYQSKPFLTGNNMCTLRNVKLNKFNALFVCTLLNHAKYKYCYGRARTAERIKEEIISLPVTSDGSPNWAYMEQYIKSLPYSDRI